MLMVAPAACGIGLFKIAGTGAKDAAPGLLVLAARRPVSLMTRQADAQDPY